MRGTRKEYLQFLTIAYASGAELETQMKIVESIKLHEYNPYYLKAKNLLTEVMKLLISIMNTMREQIEKGMK